MSESIIGANAVRVSRTRANGTPDHGNATGAFVLCGGITTFEFDYEVEAGSSIFQRDAAGNPCVNRKRPDDVKWTTFTLTLCRDDARFKEIALAGGARLLTDINDYPIGHGILGTRGCGTGVSPRGVVLELWSELVDCDVPAAIPYVRTVLPLSYMVPKGHTREDGVSLPVYQGFSQANPNIGNGPFDDFDVAQEALDDLISFEFADDELPTCASPLDYVQLPAVSS